MKNDIDTLLQKEMDRKGFIKHVAIGFAAIIGITAIAKTVKTMTYGNNAKVGYGSSTYGGSEATFTPKKSSRS